MVKTQESLVWWCRPIIPTLRKWKQEDQEEAQAHPSHSWFNTSLGYMKPYLNEKQSKEL